MILKKRAVVRRKELKFENLNYLTLIVHTSWMLLEHWGEGLLIVPTPSRSFRITQSLYNEVTAHKIHSKYEK